MTPKEAVFDDLSLLREVKIVAVRTFLPSLNNFRAFGFPAIYDEC